MYVCMYACINKQKHIKLDTIFLIKLLLNLKQIYVFLLYHTIVLVGMYIKR